MAHTVRRNGDVSFWYHEAGLAPCFPALDGPTTADVAIVGGGLTGLWAAYYLKQARPELDVLVLEAESFGYGASGRNGGWLSYGMPGLNRMYTASHGRDAVVAFQREILASVDEVVDVAAKEGIDAHVAHEGEIAVATSPAQAHRLREERDYLREWGFEEQDVELVEGDALRERFAHLAGGTLGLFSPRAARVQPARLVAGLRDRVAAMGVRLHEGTRVATIEPHRLTTTAGHAVEATWTVRGTEGFTADLAGEKRTWLPKLSSVVATEPVDAERLAAVNWLDNAVLTRDGAHSFSYVQRTADHRIVLGGPGVPYYFGSGRDANGETPEASVRALAASFDRLFPSLADVAFDHTWTGVLGIPRDWSGTVTVDRTTGACVAGGYVGDGLSGSNLAGRTLRDLITGEDTPITRLPWVGKRIRRWEPEPVRWIALRGLYGVYTCADRLERSPGRTRTTALAHVANRISGRY